jgi:hypothetical protein
MTKLKEFFINYTLFKNSIPYQVVNGGPLVAYGIGIRIHPEYGQAFHTCFSFLTSVQI